MRYIVLALLTLKSHLFGNTPAYAGKTHLPECKRIAHGKHPRVCGEDATVSASMTGARETPPRMRGRPNSQGSQRSPERNTPAYAGKTGEIQKRMRKSRKHPRVCGEDCQQNLPGPLPEETPPRMRGRLDTFRRRARRIRNTPAYAGKTAP